MTVTVGPMSSYPSVSSDFQGAVVGQSSWPVFLELVSPSGMEHGAWEQQGPGHLGASSLGGPIDQWGSTHRGVLSQKKMQLQQHMSTPKVGVMCFVEAGWLAGWLGSCELGGSSLALGTFSLPSPLLDMPDDRSQAMGWLGSRNNSSSTRPFRSIRVSQPRAAG